MRDGAGGNVVEGARQPTLPHRRGNVRQRQRDRRWRQARLLAAGRHSFPHFLEEGRGAIVHNMGHDKKENWKKITKLKRKEKCQNQKKNVKKRNRNQGKIQRYIYRKQHKEKEFKKKNERKNANRVSIKSIQHLRQKVADTVLDKR